MTYFASRSRQLAARDSRGGRGVASYEAMAGDAGPHERLLGELNRFTSKGKFGTTVWDVASGTIPPLAATTALVILQTRFLTAQTAITDPGTAVQLAAVNKAVAGGPAAVLAYVTTYEGTIADALAGYATALGLSPWSPAGAGGGPGIATMAVIGGGVLAWWLLTRGGT